MCHYVLNNREGVSFKGRDVPFRAFSFHTFYLILLISYQQVSNEEPEEDKRAPPANPPVVELGTGNQSTADDPETQAPVNPSREFLKFASQALQLDVSFITSVVLHFSADKTQQFLWKLIVFTRKAFSRLI